MNICLKHCESARLTIIDSCNMVSVQIFRLLLMYVEDMRQLDSISDQVDGL